MLPAIKGEAIIKGDFIEVRQANAHAWTEVWLQGKGWVRYDPTTAIAPERVANDVNIEQQIARQSISFAPIKLDSKTIELLKSARELWSSVDYSWQRWVINYTRKNQLNFLAGLGINSITAMFYWMIAGGLGISLVLAIIIFRKKKTKISLAEKYYQQACQKLSVLGLHKHPGEGAQDFLQRVIKNDLQLQKDFQKITELYMQLRYQRHSDSGILLKELKRRTASFPRWSGGNDENNVQKMGFIARLKSKRYILPILRGVGALSFPQVRDKRYQYTTFCI